MTANNSSNNKIGCLNIRGTRVTANNSTYDNLGRLNIRESLVIANNSTNNNIGCLHIHGTRVPANNSTNNNVFFFFSRFENRILYYLPTPLLGQDMTQGQFLSRV